MSLCNDMSATIFIYATDDGRFLVDSHFWMPRGMALEHEEKHGVPYSQWEKAGYITLVDSLTIDAATGLQIAANVAGRTGKHKMKAVYYDAWKADEVVASLEAAGLTCVPTPQGPPLWPGCETLTRRMLERTIQFRPNEVLRFCAKNARIYSRGGTYWPVKPSMNEKTSYAGARWKKIDGISALVTGLVHARKHTFANARKMWNRGQTGGLQTVAAAPAAAPATPTSTTPAPRPRGRSVMGISRRQ